MWLERSHKWVGTTWPAFSLKDYLGAFRFLEGRGENRTQKFLLHRSYGTSSLKFELRFIDFKARKLITTALLRKKIRYRFGISQFLHYKRNVIHEYASYYFTS
jgi:hypothetical protein